MQIYVVLIVLGTLLYLWSVLKTLFMGHKAHTLSSWGYYCHSQEEIIIVSKSKLFPRVVTLLVYYSIEWDCTVCLLPHPTLQLIEETKITSVT